MKFSHTSLYYSHRRATIILLGLIALYAITSGIVKVRTNNLTEAVSARITSQQEQLVSMAELITKNDVDAATSLLVKDCVLDERVEFDNLLGRLNNNLTPAELTRLDRLFGRCGGYFAERSALMIARLEREVVALEDYTALKSEISRADEVDEVVTLWRQLLEFEQTQSKLFTELVVLQDSIIRNLIEGKQPASAEIEAILERVRVVQSELIIAREDSRSILEAITNQ